MFINVENLEEMFPRNKCFSHAQLTTTHRYLFSKLINFSLHSHFSALSYFKEKRYMNIIILLLLSVLCMLRVIILSLKFRSCHFIICFFLVFILIIGVFYVCVTAFN